MVKLIDLRILLSLMLLIASCGNKHKVVEGPGTENFQWNYTAQDLLIPALLEYSECNPDKASLPNKLPGYVMAYGQWQELNFLNTPEIYPLFSHTFMPKVSFGGVGKLGEIKKASGQSSLGLCPELWPADGHLDPLESVQGAALSAMTGIEMALNLWSQNQSPIRPSLKVWMFPRLEEERIVSPNRGEKSYLVNNALYFHQLKQIVYVPTQRPTDDNPNGITPLWAYPAVSAHEVGHYILDSVLDLYSQNSMVALSTIKTQCFNSFLPISQLAMSDIDVDWSEVALVLSALHEGFADLWAYYTFHGSEYLFTGLKCMERSRNPKISTMDDSTKKKLTYARVRNFIDQDEFATSELECAHKSYDPHFIGLLWAHTVKQAFDQYEVEESRGPELMLQWAQEVAQLKWTEKSGLRFLNKTSELMQKVIADHKKLELPLKNWPLTLK